MQIAIPCVTLFVMWKMVESRQQELPTPPPKKVVVNLPSRQAPRPRPVQPTRVDVAPVGIERPAPPEKPSPPPQAMMQLPAAIELPPVADTTIASLIETGVDGELAIRTNAKELAFADDKITWAAKVIAGLRIEGGKLQFRWQPEVPADAAASLRNSLLHISAGGNEFRVALRKPVQGETLSLDLEKSTLGVNGTCDDPPPVENVRFAFDASQSMPVRATDGADARGMKVQDELLVMYAGQLDAATKIIAKKSGDVLAIVLTSQYVLPSGDVEALAVSKGNRKLTQLQKLVAQANAAQETLPKLTSYLSGCRSEYSRFDRMNTWIRNSSGRFQNPVAVAQRATGMRNASREIAATERQIQRAKQLIRNRPAIQNDLAGLERVSNLVNQIHGEPLPYRFYTIVDGHEIDLIRWPMPAE